MDTITFRGLIAPLSAEDFFDTHYGRSSVHVPGADDKFAGIFSWDACNRLLAMTSLWSEGSMKMALDGNNLEPDDFCAPGRTREGHRALRPDAERVSGLLRDGATLVLDLVEQLSPAMAAVTESICMVTAARVTCNAYCSWRGHQGFVSHFDTMDVFVLQVEGQKTWRLYEGNFENPAELPGYNHPSLPPDYHQKNKGAVEQKVTMTPGDFLYVPKGQYHDAKADSDGSLHLTFGTTQAIGQDLVTILARSLADDPLFRESLPPYDDVAAHQAHVRKVADRLREIMVESDLSEVMRAEQRRRAFAHLPGVSLPGRQQVRRYRVRGIGAKLVRGRDGWLLQTSAGERTLSEDQARVAEWVLGRDSFTVAGVSEAFDGEGTSAILDALCAARLIEPL